ncbi:UPF0462 protein C4orf33 homolog isoform X2 [Protopterus annectens]|uniref:UPF0462 protein C4orf33 homolog isoform X2 n=1 Tax=Protopterus annectens TaxID=7888 RepID=UPI001CFB0525|nr:UPF0462 protein C4orf33 homolog isoform X2 [Protopterus annectens]
MEFRIASTWDSFPVAHEPVVVTLKPSEGGLRMQVDAPFFDDPSAPPGEPGKPFDGLWEFEVVEAFFLNDTTQQYLEVELCPHGQHLLLLLSGRRNAWKQGLNVKYEASIKGDKWSGEAFLPWNMFPPGINKFNAYAIHGSEEKRTYEALFPLPKDEAEVQQKPDFTTVCHVLSSFPEAIKSFQGNWKKYGNISIA